MVRGIDVAAAARGVSVHADGTRFAQMARCLALSKGSWAPAAAIAAQCYGEGSIPALALKAPVPVGSLGGSTWGDELGPLSAAAADLLRAVRPASVIGKMSGIRRVPLNVRVPVVSAGSTASWIGEGSAAPLSAMALEQVTLLPLKVGGAIVTTMELAKLSTPAADALIRDDLVRGITTLTDRSFVDPTNAGQAGVSPASITYGAPSFAASGATEDALIADLQRLLQLVYDSEEDAGALHLITSRRQAVALSLMDSNATRGVNIGGGTLGGIPLITSSAVETTSADSPGVYESSIIAVDASAILLGDPDQATITTARHSTLEMESAPNSPQTAATVLVNLWTRDLIAWQATRFVNWQLARPGACAVITGTAYHA